MEGFTSIHVHVWHSEQIKTKPFTIRGGFMGGSMGSMEPPLGLKSSISIGYILTILFARFLCAAYRNPREQQSIGA